MSDVNERFEERAERFYQDTHVMAPGKDEAALGNHTPYETKIALWDLWCKKETEHDALTREVERLKQSNASWMRRVSELKNSSEAYSEKCDALHLAAGGLREALITSIYNRSPYVENMTGDSIADGLRDYMTEMEADALTAYEQAVGTP